MFGTIAKFFRKSAPPAPASARAASAPQQSAPGRPARPTSKIGTPAVPSLGKTASPAAAAPRAGTLASAGSSEQVVIPYAAIIRSVPQELWGKLAPAGAGASNFTLSRQQVLEQLPQGAVKVAFGLLRRNAPAGLFTNNATQDSQLMDLPLSDVLAQLNPDTLVRRVDQARVEVSDEVPDIFGTKGERLSPLRVMAKNEVAAARQQTAPAPAAPSRTVVPQAVPSMQQPSQARQASAAAASAMPPTSRAVPPAAPIKSSVPLPSSAVGAKPAGPANPLPKLPVPGASQSPAKPLPKVPGSKPAPAPGPGIFLIGLHDVAQKWPDEIRKELAQLKIPDAKLALPAAEVCEGLKRRMVQFPWRNLRAWIQPSLAPIQPSAYDNVVLELPLNTLTPLFLDHIRSSPVHQKVADAETITEFFRRSQVNATSAASLPLTPPPPAPVSVPAAPSAPSPVPGARVAQPSTTGSTPANLDGTMEIPLSQIAASCPDLVKRDMEQFNLAHSSVLVPLEFIDAGLKSGRVEFTWRQVCAWLKPPSPSAQLSINGELRVALPLTLIAPLFLQKTGGAQSRRKTRVDEDIPDLFSAGGMMPAPAAPASPVPEPGAASPAPTTAPKSAPVSAAIPQDAAPSTSRPSARNLSELFNEPDKRSWTPNDIVHYSTHLPGVAGALIALQDGLLVAACMPPQLRTEMVAAFVPQIFGRMTQYTKELQLGDTRAVSFAVESGTLQIFNAGIIYYAALSKPGATLPLADLQLIANELSRHTK